jgi:hypothetical protein
MEEPIRRGIVATLAALSVGLGGVVLPSCGDEADEASEQLEKGLEEAEEELPDEKVIEKRLKEAIQGEAGKRGGEKNAPNAP